MRFENESRGIKNFFTVVILVLNVLTFSLVISNIMYFNEFQIDFFLFSLFYLGIDLYLLWDYLSMFGHCVIDKDGIYRKNVFFEKRYKWSEILFISKVRFLRTGDYMIFSADIPREKLKKRILFSRISKRYFVLPYSQKLEAYVIIDSPEDCYTYDYIFKKSF